LISLSSSFDDRQLRSHLERCRFLPDNVVSGVQVGSGQMPLMAFSHRPFDTRTACIVAGPPANDPNGFLSQSRMVGAPLVFLGSDRRWDVWSQSMSGPELIWSADRGPVDGFFKTHKASLDPRAIFRAKTQGRLDAGQQLSFVDAGLLELVESEAGQHLCQLIERMILTTREKLDMPDFAGMNEADAQWLVKSNFWLLTARLLHDKQVPGFKKLDLEDLDNVFARVAKHYGATMGHELNQRRWRALAKATVELDRQSSLRLVSTETLAKVYENVLITKKTRKALGTHSTPSWLVDHMIQRMAPWIEEQPASRRHVYEPACGHAPFLVGMLRHYCSMKPCIGMTDADRHEWLKSRLVGGEMDDFAREVARLSLTLADIPNPNGWHLDEGDMFATGQLAQRIQNADIICSNPPFETRENGPDQLFHIGQAAELLRHISRHAKPGTLLAYIMPQTILDSKKVSGLRRELLASFEWQEILRLPDKVFEKADVETAILLGRKLEPSKTYWKPIHCRHVWDAGIESFQQTGQATIEQARTAQRMLEEEDASMLTPDLAEVWDHCRGMKKLKDVATAGQGFIFRSEDDPKYPKGLSKTSLKAAFGFEAGFFDMKAAALSHLIPPLTFMQRDPRSIRRPVAGYEMGLSQVVMNHSPVSRGPWRNVAYLDVSGHPARGSFLVIRLNEQSYVSHLFLWALINSPLANAFTKSFSSKRHILSGDLERMPLPELETRQVVSVEEAAKAYRKAAAKLSGATDTKSRKSKRDAEDTMPPLPGMEEHSSPSLSQMEELKYLHWRMDAAILSLYQLPPVMERKVLDYFDNQVRVGVPFVQTEYYPSGFQGGQTLAELLAITADWDANNERRIALIEQQEKRALRKDDEAKLNYLQHLATLRRRLVAPYPMAELDAEISRLKRENKWTE
jgi:hypothetical protein